MYRQGNVMVAGDVEVKIIPMISVEILKWMQKLVTEQSAVYLGQKFPKNLFHKSVKSMTYSRCWHLVTKDGNFIALVGNLPSWQMNSTGWRRIFRSTFDPNDTVQAALLRLGDKAKEVAFVCELTVGGYGETSYSFYPI